MIPAINVPHIQAPAPLMTELVISGVPTETNGTARLPFHAVPASVSAMPVYHNGRGGGRYDPPARPDAALPALIGHEDESARLTAARWPVPPAPYTSPFLAQLMGQPASGGTDLVSALMKAAGWGRQESDAQGQIMQRLRVSDGIPPGEPSATLPWLRMRVLPVWRGAPSQIRPLGHEGYQATRLRNDAMLKPKRDDVPAAVTL